MKRIALPYGVSTVEIEIPEDHPLEIASPQEVKPDADLQTLLRRAVRQPVGMAPFSTFFKGGENLLLLVDDITRPTPIDKILPVLLEELEIEKRNVKVTILIALGTHRKMTPTEIERKVGREIVARYPVINHDADDPSGLVFLRTTSNGTPIYVNRLLQQADVCLGISNVVPHNLAGWSGGAKIVQPGICGKETTYHTHLLAVRCPTTNMGKLNNPVRAEIEKVVEDTGLTGTINTVLDRHGTVVHIVAGEARAAHRRAVELARPIWQVPVHSLADIVVVSSYPADLDFWQANKGLHAAERIVKRGGDIILLTPCPEGLSSEREHVTMLEAMAGIPSRDQFHEARRRGLEDYAALCVSDIAARCHELAWVTVVSDGLTEDQVQVLGLGRAPDLVTALERAYVRQGSQASIAVITHGGETVPTIGED
jgi:nickel-dependent lactate racemase